MTSQPHDKRIKLYHFGNPNYSGNTENYKLIDGLSLTIEFILVGD